MASPQLAWIGLGNMGRGMCKNLVEKGNLVKPLILFNRTQQRAIDLSAKIGHSSVESSIEGAVSQADIVFSCVGDDAAITETIETALKVDVTGKLFIDCSTVFPETTAKLAKAIEAHGAHFVACPVFGAPAMAESGQLICVVAGASKLVDKIKPYLVGVIGRDIIDLSDKDPSLATKLKVIGNTFVFNMIESVAEGHVLAEKSGLGVENLHQFISKMFPGPFASYSQRMMSGDYFEREEPLFAAPLAQKDVKHANSLASSSGTSMGFLEVASKHLAAVTERKGAKGDVAGIYGVVREESGLKYENK